ncbi:MAG: BamA/TamA family outer membrane protein [Thermoanaerobaculales bacterium]
MAAPLLALLVAGALAWGEAPVAKVVLDAPGAVGPGELRRAFGISEGSRLSRAEIRAGVQALMATGAVEDVRVEIVEGEAGDTLLVHVQPVSRVRSLLVKGLPRRARKRVNADLGLHAGAPFRVKSFEAAVEKAHEDLVEDGYPQAELMPDLKFDVPRGEVTVAIEGKLGTPLVLAEVLAPGAGLEKAQLLKVTGLAVGQRLSSSHIEAARRRLVQQIRRSGFWEAEVETPTMAVHPDGAQVTFTTVRGPAFQLQVEGIRINKSLKEEALPFVLGDEPFAEAAIDLTEGRVRMYLQHQGRLLAQVHAEISGPKDPRLLRLTIKPGPLTPIIAVRFPGAHSLPTKQLREKVGARPGHFWRWGGEPVDDDTLAADASSLLGTLRAAGFVDAKVDEPRIVPEGAGVVIEFPVEEGQRRVVGELAIEGVPVKVKAPRLALTRGGPWSEAGEEQARASLEAAIQEAGYPDAQVTATHDCANGVCAEVLRAQPGIAAVVGRIVASGLVRTRRGIVDKVVGIKEGDLAGPAERLAAQRRLLALGIFQRADLRPIPGQDAGTRRGLLLDLDEGPDQALSFGLGYDTEQKVRVLLSWSELNLFGAARSLSVQTVLSSQQQRFEVDYREPNRLGVLGFPTWVSVYRTEEHFTTYDLAERGSWIELGDRLKRPLRLLLRYEYQIVEPTAPPEILSQLEREQQHLAISSISPILEWDTRDDLFTPRRGLYASLAWQNAFRALSADATFDKVTASLAAFAPARGGVLAVSLRAGAIQPHNHVAGTPDDLLLPIGVRFFGGGRVSERAFSTDMLGIPGKTIDCQPPAVGSTSTSCTLVPSGGAGQLLTSLEWRFPVRGPVGANVFLDGGNVWQAWRQINFAELRWGAGAGLRVETPVGPFRLEYGWKFKRLRIGTPPYSVVESPGELFLSFGNPF